MARVERGDLHLLEFASRMVVMAFVLATCSRGGSVCKDWFDRAGLMLHWLTRNVLSVSDFTWSREGMELVMQDGSVEQEALRGEVCGYPGRDASSNIGRCPTRLRARQISRDHIQMLRSSAF